MQSWTIQKRIAFGFSILVALVVVLAISSFTLLSFIKKEVKAVKDQSIVVLTELSEAAVNTSDAQIAVLRAIATDSVERVKELNAEIGEYGQINNEIYKIYETEFLTDAQSKAIYAKMCELRDANSVLRNQLMDMLQKGLKLEAQPLVPEVREAYLIYQKEVANLLDHEESLAIKNSQEALNLSSFALVLTVVVSALVFIFAIISGVLTVRSLNKVLSKIAGELTDGANHVTSAAGQVSAASQQLAEGSSEQAAGIEETSASLNEISSQTQSNADNAKVTRDFAHQARQAAQEGSEGMESMKGAIDEIRGASSEMQEAMDSIKEASNDISNIIKTIDEIAFQTNLLALNAAVEAARAGEAGAGFAVVAGEVRNLAQRSATAAKETADMIETAVERSEKGARTNEKVISAVEGISTQGSLVGDILENIMNKVMSVDSQVGEIAEASREQSEGVAQVTTAVEQMEQVVQSNASNAEESAAAAEELNSQAEVLRRAVGELEKLVKGSQS